MTMPPLTKALMNSNSEKTAIIIAGPTATGKTKLSIKLASCFSTEIISADSRQFYKELKIGTAAPDASELSQARHHFIGNISIHDYYNVSIYEQQALMCAAKIFRNHPLLFVTGGSGLYISAFCQGIDDLPDPRPELRQQLKNTLQNEGIDALRRQLSEADPEYYAIADLANPKRLMRALEVFYTTGSKYSLLRKNTPKTRDFRIIKIGINRDRNELAEIIGKRVDAMMANGLLEEARIYYPLRHLNALNTVGYKELFEYFDGKICFEKAVENIKTNTRRYAKRQMTWFRKDPEFKWFHPDDTDGIISHIEALIKER